jgi:Flp pilus assembly protein TadB
LLRRPLGSCLTVELAGIDVPMRRSDDVADPVLERQGRAMARPAPAFLVAAGALLIVGIVLLLVGGGWVWTLGVVLVFLACIPLVVGVGLLCAAAISRWAARRRPFA